MKIGIFDPNLDSEGHYLKFNEHIIKLLGDKNNEIIFFDVANIFKNNCKEENIEFINVADTTMAELSGELKILSKKQFIFLIKEFFWYKKVVKKIQKSKIDFLIITSYGYFSFYFFIPKVKFAVTIHFARPLFFEKKYSVRYFMQILRQKIILRFLRRAEIVFAFSEYLKDKMSGFNFKRTEWMPYICFENSDSAICPEKKVKEFSLLTPGAIYRSKNIDFVLNVYKKYNLNFKYIVAGSPVGSYGKKIVNTIKSLEKNFPITGIFKYLSNEEYEKMIQCSSFVLLPYSGERINGISAVMYDAFANNTPIIAPNIKPFDYYINKYSVGLLYEPNEDSFVSVLREASKIDKSIFKNGFERFKKDFFYSSARERFNKIIRDVIN